MNPDSRDARRRPDRLRSFVAVVVVLVASLVLVPSALAGGKLLVYDPDPGEDTVAVNEGYTQFAAAAGRTVTTSTTLPAPADTPVNNAAWDEYACLVLPVVRAVNPPPGNPAVGVVDGTGFTTAYRTAIMNYALRGGTVVAIAEHLNADPNQQVGPATVTTMNNLASGTGIQALNTTRNQGPTVTTNPLLADLPVGGVAAKYRKDVTDVGFAAATTLTVTAPAVVSREHGQDGDHGPGSRTVPRDPRMGHERWQVRVLRRLQRVLQRRRRLLRRPRQ